MRIALLVDESLPKGTRVHSKMMHELAVQFQKLGHKCIVITPGASNQASLLEVTFYEGVEIWHFKSGKLRGVGYLLRVFNEWLLSKRAWKAISSKANNPNFDLCINYSPTIFWGPLAKKFKKNGAFIYLVLRDLFPQWLIDEGIISKHSIATLFFRRYEKINYDTANSIGLMSKGNLELFSKLNPDYNNTHVLMNWISTKSEDSSSIDLDIRKQLSLKEKVIFFYGGNIGKSNDMPNLIRLAKNIQKNNKAYFLIIGQGDQVQNIKELINTWHLNNVTILPSVTQSDFKEILKQIDVGLFTLSKKHTSHNFPGKILGYMLESKPILGSVNPKNDLMQIINNSKSGFISINGDDENLKISALKLLENHELRSQMGKNSKNLLEEYFSVESAAANILKQFKNKRL